MGATITILLCAALTLAGIPFLLISIILFILFFRNRHNGTAQTKKKFTAACISVFIGALLISPLLDVISMITIDNPLFILLAGLLLISSLLIYFVYIFIKKCRCASLSNKTLIGFAGLYFITTLLCVPLAAGITILRIVNSGEAYLDTGTHIYWETDSKQDYFIYNNIKYTVVSEFPDGYLQDVELDRAVANIEYPSSKALSLVAVITGYNATETPYIIYTIKNSDNLYLGMPDDLTGWNFHVYVPEF